MDAAWALLAAAATAHVTATVEVHADVAAAGLVVSVRCEHPKAPFEAALPVPVAQVKGGSEGERGVQEVTAGGLYKLHT